MNVEPNTRLRGRLSLPSRALRSWVFTLWPTDSDDKRSILSSLEALSSRLLAGRELCPNTGRVHIHGVCTLRTPMRAAGLKRILGSDAHVEERRGTAEEAENYAAKEGDIIADKRGHQGARTDISDLRAALDAGGLPEAKRLCPDTLIRYATGAAMYCRITPQVDRGRPKVYIFTTRESGTGKSLTARSVPHYPARFLPNAVWFDGYAGERIMVLDEYDGALPFRFFLSLIDYGKLMLPIKGGFVPCAADTFVITSNTIPTEWYPSVTQLDPLVRRLTEFAQIHYQNPFPQPRVD